ncbi:MAG: transglutaminase-like domain-containing protein [Candidatus Hodarchaeales archaeon]|jgi:hypothetical protein
MSTEKLEKDPAPSAIRYLILASAFTCLVTTISFVQAIIGSSTQEEQFYQSVITGFTLIFVISMVEWFVLRRSRKMVGPYGFAFVIEIVKTLLFYSADIQYIKNVSGASSSTFFLHQIISLAIIFMLALTKVARTRIEQLAQKDVSRNLLNLLPTILILTLFLGTYVTEIAGLGTPRQRNRFKGYEDKDILWDLYHTPTWDATYLLENLLDQFTSGIKFPNEALFNVSNEDGSDPTSPPAYWRLGSLETYEFFDKGEDPTSRWTSIEPVANRELTPNVEGTPYSNEIDSSERAARYKVQLPLDYSDSIADFTVNPSFTNYLPTTWNGRNGSYVDADSFVLKDAYGGALTPISSETQEVYPEDYGPNFQDLLGISADVTMGETSTEEGIFEYIMEYKDISETLYDAAMFSKTKDDYQSILGSADWNDFKAIYLQLPNTTEELPNGVSTYSEWAPTVVSEATSCSIDGISVFSQAYADMQRLAPVGYINQSEKKELPDSTGELDLWFDFDMWLGEYAQNAAAAAALGEQYEMPHPDPDEDYNEWFLTNGNGTAMHFASLFATIMRLRDIPSRVVIGYLGGQPSQDESKRTITNMMLHAWIEVLIPIEEILPIAPFIDQRAEWVSFDPLLNMLSDVLEIDIPIDMPGLSQLESTRLIDSDLDHQTNGPFNPLSLAAWNYTTTNVSGLPFAPRTFSGLQENVNLSVRLMMITGPNSWMPWQPSCDHIGTNVSFYVGTSKSWTANTTFIDNSSIDGSGYASVMFPYDVMDHGDTVWLFAYVTFGEITKRARSLKHSIF